MAAQKVLVDNNLPAHLKDSLYNAGWRVEWTRDHLPKKARAEDPEILIYAHQKNWYVITEDSDFRKTKEIDCDPDTYASRTVLDFPVTGLRTAGKYVIEAWRTIGWKRVLQVPVIKVCTVHATLYECDGTHYKAVDIVPIKLPD